MKRMVSAVVIRDNRMLLVRKGGGSIWTLPSVELKPGGTAEECLGRELEKHYIGVGQHKFFRYFKRVECLDRERGEVVDVDVYLATINGTVVFDTNADITKWAFDPTNCVLSDDAWIIANIVIREGYLIPRYTF